MKKILALILVIVMIASCFAGCSGKSVTIGYTKKDIMNYTDENGDLVGFDVELATAVFNRMGYTVTFTELEEDKLVAELAAGNIDCIWNGFNSQLADTTTMELSYEYAKTETEAYAVVFTLGNELVDEVNDTLKKLADEGETAKLAKKYDLEKKGITAVIDFTAAIADGIVVGYAPCEPFNYTDAEGNLVGFDTELATAVFEGLGYSVIFKEIDLDTKYTMLDSDKIDCIWNGFASNAVDADGVARADKVAFSYNYMANRQVVVVKKDSGITGAADLLDKAGCALASSAGEEYLLSLGCALPYALGTQAECLDAVKNGTYDCSFAIVDEYLAKSYCAKEENADLEILSGMSGDSQNIAVAFLKWRNGADNEESLLNQVNAQLEKLAADGTIAALAEKYGLSSAVVTDFADQKK